MPEAELAELHGCDMHGPGIEWLAAHVPPQVHVFTNEELPPLDRPASSFDLIWAISVFTHLTDSWSQWLLEIHRLLQRDGLFLTTFHNWADHARLRAYDPEPWSEDTIGMNIMAPGVGWESGGPAVFHSRWWLEAHWGRAFDVVSLRTDGFGGLTQGVALLRKRDVSLEPADLERPEPNEPRELAAAWHNIRQLSTELRWVTPDRDAKAAELKALEAKLAAADRPSRRPAQDRARSILRSWRGKLSR